MVKKKLSKTILRLFALLVNRRENICSFCNLQISDIMRDETTTQLKLCVCRVACAVILKNVFDEISNKFGIKAAEEITGKACSNSAIAHGAAMADVLEKKPYLSDFAGILPNRTKEEALEIEVLDEAASVMNFNVTRCRYAEMYEEMGLKDIGHLLSCSRDADFCEGYNSEIKFERIQTIMKGAKYCDFRLKFERKSCVSRFAKIFQETERSM